MGLDGKLSGSSLTSRLVYKHAKVRQAPVDSAFSVTCKKSAGLVKNLHFLLVESRKDVQRDNVHSTIYNLKSKIRPSAVK